VVGVTFPSTAAIPLTPAFAAAPASTPDPTPTGGLQGVVSDAGEAGSAFWEWFVGWPLQLILVLVVGTTLLLLLRRLIRAVTDRIATGETKRAAKAHQGTVAEAALLRANPVAIARRASRARTVGSVLRSTADVVIVGVMAVLVLAIFGVDVTKFLAAAGVVGIAVGFGAQSLIKDFFSGFFLLVEDQYGVGDNVDLGAGVAGVVEDMGLRLTTVRSADGTVWYVRNGEILRAGNKTQDWARAVATVVVPLGSDVDAVRAALGRAADAVHEDDVLSHYLLEAPAVQGIDVSDAGGLEFSVRVRTRPAMQWEVERALRTRVHAELVRAAVLGTEAATEEAKADGV
jgi:moderate conductance mechanosensitive channel